MAEIKLHLTPKGVAKTIIEHSQGRTPLGANKKEEPIPQQWTFVAEGNFPGTSCLVNHGLIDEVFERGPIHPENWFRFERQYRSPQAEVVERIFADCQGRGMSGIIADSILNQEGRNWFFVSGNPRSNITQEFTLKAILAYFTDKGFIERPSRKYKDEKYVVGLAYPGYGRLDLPTTYRGLERTALNMVSPNMEYVTVGDYPKVEKFGKRIPVCHMVARTINIGDKSNGRRENKSFDKLISLVKENSHPAPSLQKILYVLGETTKDDETGKVAPRYVGIMIALMLEFAYGTPAGVRLSDRSYMVPQPDLTAEERENLETSTYNFENHREILIEDHKDIFS